jgi:hypothetical protein
MLAGLVFGLGLIEAGVVLTAYSLHQLFAEQATGMDAAARAGGGVLLAFVGARACLSIAGASVRVTWRQALASLPDFSMAGWFVVGWAAPEVIGPESAGLLVGVMVLEFIIIHASVMLSVGPEQLAQQVGTARWRSTPRMMTAGLLALYSLFAAGIGAAFQSVWLFVAFWGLMANKFISGWLAPTQGSGRRRQDDLSRWGLSALLYLLLAFGSVAIPVPRLAAVSGSHGSGLWEQEPQQALAMGALYFLLLAFAELYGVFDAAKAAGGEKRQEGGPG